MSPLSEIEINSINDIDQKLFFNLCNMFIHSGSNVQLSVVTRSILKTAFQTNNDRQFVANDDENSEKSILIEKNNWFLSRLHVSPFLCTLTFRMKNIVDHNVNL